MTERGARARAHPECASLGSEKRAGVASRGSYLLPGGARDSFPAAQTEHLWLRQSSFTLLTGYRGQADGRQEREQQRLDPERVIQSPPW